MTHWLSMAWTMSGKKAFTISLTICICCMCIYVTHKRFNVNIMTEKETSNSPENASQLQQDTIRILRWHNSDITNFSFPQGNEVFKQCSLPKDKMCEIVADKTLYNETEAVIF